MAFELRSAGWAGAHSAGHHHRPRPATVVLAAGALAVLAGLALLAASLSPMFGVGSETATVAQPMQPLQSSQFGGLGGSATGDLDSSVAFAVDRPVNGVAFTMRVPALDYSAKVYEGTDEKTLLRGPGHYPTSAWPGRNGNVGVAAHNVYWLSFARLKAGDRVELQTRHGMFVYAITGSRVVQASDRTVLAPSADHRLTLTTCSPLWAGAFATKRLVFFATEIGGVA
jgi:LPXTG-site transpeptidase (sortase) family protein